MFYSKSMNAFFDGGGPEDVVEISETEWQDLLNAVSDGFEMYGDDAGRPALRARTVPEPIVPSSVSMRQARLALLAIGRLDDVLEAVAEAGRAAQIEMEFATTVDRDNPLVAQLGETLSLDLDALFAAAIKL